MCKLVSRIGIGLAGGGGPAKWVVKWCRGNCPSILVLSVPLAICLDCDHARETLLPWYCDVVELLPWSVASVLYHIIESMSYIASISLMHTLAPCVRSLCNAGTGDVTESRYVWSALHNISHPKVHRNIWSVSEMVEYCRTLGEFNMCYLGLVTVRRCRSTDCPFVS